MSRPAVDFVVYPCGACGKRVFTDRAHVGQLGACPCCGVEHTIGGAQPAHGPPNRRRARRVTDPRARVAVNASRGAGELHELGDISTTGIAFKLPGVVDRRRLDGIRPPPLEVGDVVKVTLHAPELFRARAFYAEVRRVAPGRGGSKGLFVVGARFVELTDSQRRALEELVARRK